MTDKKEKTSVVIKQEQQKSINYSKADTEALQTGKRKNAVARVMLRPGSGKNGYQ